MAALSLKGVILKQKKIYVSFVLINQEQKIEAL